MLKTIFPHIKDTKAAQFLENVDLLMLKKIIEGNSDGTKYEESEFLEDLQKSGENNSLQRGFKVSPEYSKAFYD